MAFTLSDISNAMKNSDDYLQFYNNLRAAIMED
jgi:hypothetical protein